MKNQLLIETLSRCAAACWYCAAVCLNEDHVKALSKCIVLSLDCAGIVNFAAELASMESKLLSRQLELCIEICRRCAEECEQNARNGIQYCKECAEACRNCEEECIKHLMTDFKIPAQR